MVQNGKLYDLPIMVAVLSLFDLKVPTQRPITDAYGSFTIGNGLMTIEDLLFTGGAIPIYMEGFIGLQANLESDMQPIFLIITIPRRDTLLDQIPIVNLLKRYTIDFLRRMVFQARVTGTLGDYRVTNISTPIVAPIQKMFSLIERLTSQPEALEELF